MIAVLWQLVTPVALNGCLDKEVRHKAGEIEWQGGDGGGGVGLQPFLYGSPLIDVPICCNHWAHDHHL